MEFSILSVGKLAVVFVCCLGCLVLDLNWYFEAEDQLDEWFARKRKGKKK